MSILPLDLAHGPQGASGLHYPSVFHPLGAADGESMEVKNSRGKKPTKNPLVEGSMGRLWPSDPLCRDTWFSLSKSANNTEKTN